MAVSIIAEPHSFLDTTLSAASLQRTIFRRARMCSGCSLLLNPHDGVSSEDDRAGIPGKWNNVRDRGSGIDLNEY